MKLILKTLSVSLVLAIAGCANTGSTSNASLGAADDTPSCCGSTACAEKAAAKTDKASLGAADDAPSCASSCSTACKAKCDANMEKAKMEKAKMKGSSLGAFDDSAKSNASCGAEKSAGSCPFSGGKN